jgi:hypothetical protein
MVPQPKELGLEEEGRPGQRTGGGSRSDCPLVEVPLTAIMPENYVSTSIASHPTFLVYVPYTADQAPIGRFVLQAENLENHFEAELTLPETPGLVSVSLPETAAGLPPNRYYRWFFSLYCDLDLTTSPVFVQGWVQRVSTNADLEAQLANAPDRSYQAYVYSEIWGDAIADLASRMQANPTDRDLIDAWEGLLQHPELRLTLTSTTPFVGAVRFLDAAEGAIPEGSEPVAN